jgi:hypothetical protein
MLAKCQLSFEKPDQSCVDQKKEPAACDEGQYNTNKDVLRHLAYLFFRGKLN